MLRVLGWAATRANARRLLTSRALLPELHPQCTRLGGKSTSDARSARIESDIHLFRMGDFANATLHPF